MAQEDRRNKLIAAFAFLILLALLLQAIKPGGIVSTLKASASPTPAPTPTVFQDEPIEGVSVVRTFSQDSSQRTVKLQVRVANKDAKNVAQLLAFTIVPQSTAPEGSSAVTVGYSNAVSQGFASENPALHEAVLMVPAGGQSIVTANVKFEQAQPPLFVLAGVSLQQNAEGKQAFEEVLKKSASLSLSPAATSALGALLSKIFLEGGKTLEEKVALAGSVVNAYEATGTLGSNGAVGGQLFSFAATGSVEESVQSTLAYATLVARLQRHWQAHPVGENGMKATVNALNDAVNAQGSFFEKFVEAEKVVAREESKLGASGAGTATPVGSTAQNSFDPYELLKELGGSVEIVVTELTPVAAVKLPLKAKAELGYPLTKFSGEAAAFLGQQASFEEGTVLNVRADVSTAEDFASGQIGFDELQGEMTLKFLSLPEKEVKVPVKIRVEHVDLFEESCSEEYDATSYLEERAPVALAGGECASDGAAVAREALKHVGRLPYVWGGTSLANGADCSGFTQAIMRKFGATIPRTAREQFEAGVQVQQLVPGDLVFERNTGGRGGVTHVGIYVGEAVASPYGKCAIIHEPGRGRTATLGSMCGNYWKGHYAGAVRVLSSCKQTLAAPTKISFAGEGFAGKTVAIDLEKGTVGGECAQATVQEMRGIEKMGLLLSQKLSQSGANVLLVRQESCSTGQEQNWRDRAAKASSADVLLEVGYGGKAPSVFVKGEKKSRKLGAVMLSQLQAVATAGELLEAKEGSSFYATVPSARVHALSQSSAFNDEDGIEAITDSVVYGLQIFFGSEPSKQLSCKQGGEQVVEAATPKVAACEKFSPLVQLELGKAGLLARGVTTEFVVAQIMQESSCRGSNPMKVLSCNGGCSLQENIARGVSQHLLPAYNAGRKAGLSGERLLRFMGLYYNRGSGTASLAQKLWKQGVPFTEALNQACENNFEEALCNKPGYGAYYYNKVQERCLALYGKKCETNVI